MRERMFLGIDVGTGSVRVGAFNRQGRLRGKAEHPIRIWRPQPDFVEQSSEDIWKATAKATKQCLRAGRINPKWVSGISFDATCSLVALGVCGWIIGPSSRLNALTRQVKRYSNMWEERYRLRWNLPN